MSWESSTGESVRTAPAGPVPDDEIPPQVPGVSRVVETNGVELHVIEAGPADGPLLVLLHGFPEFWYGWHEVIRPLAADGFRVVVPDQRGYNLSETPAGVSNYRLEELAADVLGLLDHYECETARIAGHDWGGAVGWWVAMTAPNRVGSFVGINAPHPKIFEETLRNSWTQRYRSWYIAAFQIPRLPERVFRAGNWKLLVRGMDRSSLPGTFTPADFARYRRAWSRGDSITAMLHWYRAQFRDPPTHDRTAVAVPTLIIWGTRDEFLVRSLAHDSLEKCSDGRLLSCTDATHWVVHEEPIHIANEIADHARSPSSRAWDRPG